MHIDQQLPAVEVKTFISRGLELLLNLVESRLADFQNRVSVGYVVLYALIAFGGSSD